MTGSLRQNSDVREAGGTVEETAPPHARTSAGSLGSEWHGPASREQRRGWEEALRAGRDHLMRLQHEQGWWKGELQTNVTMDAEDLMLRQFLGIREEQDTADAARWIRSQQREDGTWAAFHGGPGELSATVEAYVALKLAGDGVDEEHMAAARRWILRCGGIESTRVFTRMWLAMFGQWSWDELPAMPPEIVMLPSWVPLNLADWGCWARQTIVPLTVVNTLRPVRELGVGTAELRTGGPVGRVREDAGTSRWETVFNALDRVLHVYQRHPLRPLRRQAMSRAAEWIVARQEADGSWGGIQPPWVYSLIALHLLGYQLDHPVMRTGLQGLEGFLIRQESERGTLRRLEACQSPVWDTVLSIQALHDAGVPDDDPSIRDAVEFVRAEEITVRGDWAVRRPELPAGGGWAFEFENDGYPDIDDTAEVLLAFTRTGYIEQDRISAAVDRGRRWLRGMQSRGGGWGAFDADNTRWLVNKLPFCDFGAVIDPPSADVTAHVVEALAHLGDTDDRVVRDGVRWLFENQENDGSWYGRWGANHVYGTGAVVPALVSAGIPPEHCALRRAVRWLERHQNSDGGWGEDLRSYTDPSWIGRGESTPSQTAWALLALLAVGRHDTDPVRRGVAFLAEAQREDGSWEEPQFTGTGFPGDFYINYHLYRQLFPVTALGRYRQAVTVE
ncbi:squalene-hopene/tetraprenyl-beta-curcumene cyclase [Actinopolyspora xinjiangensis]|uniref:Squalene-hopene/tetraprenyl-beta-curcumene cyclase n=1 Tax=Actinopolyspora xinjiangensis TaxID=405564 RepID=A0A1H0WNE9_9ACTN|nr:squalene--hopene cyclase [Actinopolyspora xinjiangensis]SDP92202.1 squalene-hopene/tetraprenyl-beta-curcumene cyclase [Actinopolyspora xinjiangensis]